MRFIIHSFSVYSNHKEVAVVELKIVPLIPLFFFWLILFTLNGYWMRTASGGVKSLVVSLIYLNWVPCWLQHCKKCTFHFTYLFHISLNSKMATNKSRRIKLGFLSTSYKYSIFISFWIRTLQRAIVMGFSFHFLVAGQSIYLK